MDATGAIIGSVLSHVFICMTEGVYLRNELPISKMFRNILPYLLCGLIMAVCVILFANHVTMSSLLIKLISEVALGVVVYLVLCSVNLYLQGDRLKYMFKYNK